MNWFKKKTNYPKQQLSDKQIQLLDLFDSELTEKSKGSNEYLNVLQFKLNLWDQAMPVNVILSKFRKTLVNIDITYIPRSIAFITEFDGTWTFYIGIRAITSTDDLANSLFIDALSRTNQARSNNESNKI